ncbi:uncharacterized protein LOC143020803 isoform X2 [Oratosquilla oratoria]|uniref:uncharacterized protein LOC143020803 isoform X2 n=1 Tax=Oratosquilla oratoria TaxID=337810 RepID=UPI003F770575
MTKRRNLASQGEGANKSTRGPTGFYSTFTRLYLLEGKSRETRTSCSAILERQRRALHEKVTIPFARLSRTAQEGPTAPTAGPRTHASPTSAQMASLSTAATVLVLSLGLGGFFCFAELRCVDVNLVKGGSLSTRVPFPKSMEVEFLHERLDAGTSEFAEMVFYIEEDREKVAFANVVEDLNNALHGVILKFKKDGTWGKETIIKNEDPFNVGTLRRVRLEYSGGLFQGVVWSGDRQKNMTWSREDAPTMGQGNLTVYARIPVLVGKHSSVVFWPRTCSPDPLTTSQSHGPSACTPTYIWILAVLTVALVILLVLLSFHLRRAFGLLKDKGENRERDPVAQKDEGSEERCNQGPPARHRERRERGASEGRDSINSVYGYIPRD